MNWRVTIYWGSLAVLVGLLALGLTHWITSVHLGSDRPFAVVFDETSPNIRMPVRFTDEASTPQRRQLPRIILIGYDELMFVVTPTTHGVHILGYTRNQFSCNAMQRSATGASSAAIVQAVRRLPLEAVDLTPSSDSVVNAEAVRLSAANGLSSPLPVTDVVVPGALEAQVRAQKFGQGVIICHFKVPLAASPTFTDRSLTIVAPSTRSTATLLDVSALRDIQNLRFLGGVVIPWAGDRARVFDKYDEVISVEWSDVVAEEKRDVFLVIIGALAAIAASTGLEAIRPIVEHLTRTEY